MENERIDIREFHLKLEEEQVLALAGCTSKNPHYLRWKIQLQTIWKESVSVFQPKAYIKKMWLSGKRCGYACLFTLGEEAAAKLATLQQKDMEAAVLFDSLNSQLVFQMDLQLQEQIKKLSQKEHHGIAGRLEAPLDYPLEEHARMLEEFEKEGSLPVHLTKGYQFEPEKSMLVFYEWSEKEGCYQVEHDCSNCPKTDCVVRQSKKERGGIE